MTCECQTCHARGPCKQLADRDATIAELRMEYATQQQAMENQARRIAELDAEIKRLKELDR